MKVDCRVLKAMELEEELKEKQHDAQQKVDALKELIDNEKKRLDAFKLHLDKEKDAYMEILKKLYAKQVCPSPDVCAKKEKALFKENLGDFTVCVKDPGKKELCEGENLLVMNWANENENDPTSGTKDQMLVQLEKQLNDDMVLQMQLETKGQPRKVCPCKAKRDGIISPFPPSPHSHTTYYKAELTICDLKQNNEVKVTSNMKRFDKIRNINSPESFCRSGECN